MEEIDLESLEMKELKKIAFKVDLLPKNFPISGMFQMGGMMFLHVKERYCMAVRYSDEINTEIKA